MVIYGVCETHCARHHVESQETVVYGVCITLFIDMYDLWHKHHRDEDCARQTDAIYETHTYPILFSKV